MKSLIGKIKRILHKQTGEILMEAIVSVLLLAILLVTITTMIQTSRNITANSMQEARQFQEEVLNPAVLASDEQDLVTGNIAFTFTPSTTPLTLEHKIIILENNGNIVAFYPAD